MRALCYLACMANAPNHGQWSKGQSGNPGGRPKLPDEVKAGLRDLAGDAIAVLREALQDEDPRVRVAAAGQILDRAYGKPASVADVTLRHGVDLAAAHLEMLAELVRAPTIESETPPDNE